MIRDVRGLPAALDDAVAAARARGAPGAARGTQLEDAPLRTWLLLVVAGLAASARGVVGAPRPDQLARAARSSADALAHALDDALAALGLACSPPDPRVGPLAARLLLLGMGGDPSPLAELDEACLGAAREAAMAPEARRRSGAHSTPRPLAEALADDGLAALHSIGAGGDALRVLDPAAGGGALLLAVGRAVVARAPVDERRARRRLVAGHLFGVERDPAAAQVARAALALWGAADGDPAPDVGRQIATGDVLASLDAAEVERALGRPLAVVDPRLAREVADALVGGFFAVAAARRAEEIARRTAAARAAGEGQAAALADVARWAEEARSRGAVHPALVWPGPFDLAVLNPPFLGGKRIATVHGDAYAAWLAEREPGASGNADLAAHVLLATRRWLAPRSAMAIVATNTLVEGATRHAAMERLLEEGHTITSAWRSERWPGTASVSVVRVTLARGGDAPPPSRLDGAEVASIDAGLRAAARRAPPRPLEENAGVAFVGFFLRGDGFIVDDAEARALLARDPRHLACLRPYLVGEDVLRDPEQLPRRWVIDFGARSLEEARELPILLDLVERRVRPTREALAPTPTNRSHRRAWWRFANPRPELRAALAGRARCIVAPRVSKHLAFAAVPADHVFSEQLVVVATDAPSVLGALLSSAHAAWARAHSSSLQSGLRYLPSRAFATFPFPARHDAVDAAASALVTERALVLRELHVGLTTLRDRIDDPCERDPRVLRVRHLHDTLDRTVLAAFGWPDLAPRRRGPGDPGEDEAFEVAVVERLSDENERRARRGDGRPALV